MNKLIVGAVLLAGLLYASGGAGSSSGPSMQQINEELPDLLDAHLSSRGQAPSSRYHFLVGTFIRDAPADEKRAVYNLLTGASMSQQERIDTANIMVNWEIYNA